MQIQIKEAEIVTAIKEYLTRKGLRLDGKKVTVSFTARRNNMGLVADVDIDDAGIPGFSAPGTSSTDGADCGPGGAAAGGSSDAGGTSASLQPATVHQLRDPASTTTASPNSATASPGVSDAATPATPATRATSAVAATPARDTAKFQAAPPPGDPLTTPAAEPVKEALATTSADNAADNAADHAKPAKSLFST